MPLESIMNAPRNFGPSITERQDAIDMNMAKGYADTGNSLAEMEMRKMKNSASRQKQSILQNFEGRTDSPEFYAKMGTVDPALVAKMKESAAKLDKDKREQASKFMDQTAVRARMADTPEAWQQEGFSVPFEQRDRVLAQSMTFKQLLDSEGGGSEGTALMKNTKFLTDSGISKDKALNYLLKSKEMSADAWERMLIRDFSKDIKTRRKAKEMARELREYAYGQGSQVIGGGQGGTPEGFQSGAGPSSGKDYSNLWGGGAM